jgi:hypothetical protein
MSASLTKRLQLPRRGSRSTWAQAVRIAISEGQPDTAYALAKGLAHMVRNEWKDKAHEDTEGREQAGEGA